MKKRFLISILCLPVFNLFGQAGAAFSFDGSNDRLDPNVLVTTIFNNFTYELWAKPTATHEIDAQSTSGTSGVSNQKYVLWPTWRNSDGGIGISVGTNGVSVYEHGSNFMPPLAVWSGTITGWTHIAVTVINKQPFIYINGILVQTGLTSTRANVFPSLGECGQYGPLVGGIGGGTYGYFNGEIDEFRLWGSVRTQTQIVATMSVELNCPGPYAYYKLNHGTAFSSNTSFTTATDYSGNNFTALLYNTALTGTSSNWVAPGAATLVPSPNSPTITASTPTPCAGQSITLSLNGTLTGTWSNGSVGNSITISPSIPTLYSVISTTSNCTYNSTLAIFPNALPTLTINSSTNSICVGQSATISVSGAQNYTWLPINISGSVVVMSPSVSTMYSISALDINNCAATNNYSLTVYSLPTLTLTPSSSSVCTGITVSLTASGAVTHTWLPSGIQQSSLLINPTSSSTYTALGTSSLGCVNSGTTSVFVFNTNSISIAPATSTLCLGKTITLTAMGVSSYTWLPFFVTGSTFTHTPIANTGYSLQGTDANGCITGASKNITVVALPFISFNTFSINCGNLGSATVNATGGTGPFNYSWSPTSQTGSVATGLFPATYTLTVLDNGTGCTKISTTSFLPLIPLTGTVSSTPSLTCNGINTATASIALSGGSSSQTYTWTTSSGSQNTIGANLLPAGLHTVVVSDVLTHCSVTKTFVVTQPPALTLNIASSNVSVCMGSNINFTAIASGGVPAYSYTWMPGNINQTYSVSEGVAGIYTYSIQSRDANNCLVTNSINVSFVPNPTVTVSDVSICPFQIASLQAQGASSYSWNTSQTGGTISLNPTTTTHYTVVGTSQSCTSAASASVIVKPVPVASFTSNAPVCVGDSIKIFGVGSVQSYTWTGPSFFASNVQNPFISNSTLPNSGIYMLKVTAPNSCTNVTTQTLMVNPLPFVSVWASTVCEGSNLLLYSTTTASSVLLWTANGFTSSINNPIISNANLNMSGIYSLQAISVNGCINSATTTAVVLPKPIISVVANATLCAGSTLSLQGSGGGSYAWIGPSGFYNYQQNTGITNISVSQTGKYILTVVSGPCTVKDSVQVLVNALPSITVTSNNPVCEQKPLNLIASGASTYQWNSPIGASINQPSCIISSCTFADAGIYTVTAISQAGCVNTKTITINILANPIPILQNALVCLGETATLSATGAAGYAWTGPAGFTASTSVIVISNVSQSNSGVYTVVCIGSNACSTSATLLLQGNPFPLPQAIIGIPKKICIGSTLTFSSSGGVSYNWSGPLSFSSSNQYPQLSISDTQVEGIYTLSVKDASNCSGTGTVQVKVLPKPEGTIISSVNNLCLPFSSDFRIKLKPAKTKAPLMACNFWLETKNVQDTVATFFFTKQNIYTLSAVYMDTNTCTNSATLAIKGNPKPTADFYYQPEKPYAGSDEVYFTNTSSGAELNSWMWLLKENFRDTLSIKNPTNIYSNPGSYPVVLIVKNKWGCSDTLIKYVVVSEELALYVPNAFTPNGDGLNDVFRPKGLIATKYNLAVFNRWGEQVFATNEFTEGWDGQFRGQHSEDGVYIWKIEITDTKGKAANYCGTVKLIRKNG